MNLSEFDYTLPEKLIAQIPTSKRESSKLMIVDRKSGEIEHSYIKELPKYFTYNDLLVFNNTKIIPARINAQKESGGKVEILLLKEIEPLLWEVLLKRAGRIKEGSNLVLNGNKKCIIEKKYDNGKSVIRFNIEGNFYKWLNKNGSPPLPPYIKRKHTTSVDKDRYQTVYAKKRGSIAAPTAGLHFTDSLLSEISKKGVETAFITLHIGIGTFQPVRSENINNHKMENETFDIDSEEIKKIKKGIKNKKRIISVGSTSVRTLETIISENLDNIKYRGETNLFIKPGYNFKCTDAMLTNFHLPKSTLYILVCALAGPDLIRKSYTEAIKNKYRFYSYGDAMLIL